MRKLENKIQCCGTGAYKLLASLKNSDLIKLWHNLVANLGTDRIQPVGGVSNFAAGLGLPSCYFLIGICRMIGCCFLKFIGIFALLAKFAKVRA